MPAEPPSGPPAGFPGCPKCPYLRTGPPQLCLDCATKSFDVIGAGACPVCSQIVYDASGCPNWLCHDPFRSIGRIHAIAYLSGPLRKAVLRYKYDGAWGWSLIFSRLVVAWLDRNALAEPPDLIVANPTFVATGSPRLGHIERVLDAAASEDVLGRWPFDIGDPPAIVKTAATEKSAKNTAPAKRATAAALRQVLSIPDRSRIEGRRVLIYDDVCTTGSQLDTVAACLAEDGGAASVDALVLARAPWRPRSASHA
jgi:predicted amidophosphoribosyltransferase